MAYDEGLAEIMRGDFDGIDGVSERRMFGGLCFLLSGNMVCGVHSGGGLYRVGKTREAEARDVPGTGPMTFTGRPMGGMVDVTDDLIADDTRRGAVFSLALAHAQSLPPK